MPNVDQSASPAELQGIFRDVHPAGRPEDAQLLQHQARSAARVQDFEVVPVPIALLDPVQDDVATCRQPPVRGLGVVQDLVGMCFQPAVFNQPGRQFDQASIISPFVSSGLGRA